MRLHASVIARRRSTLDSSFLGRRGVGRGHPTLLTSRLMREVHDRTFCVFRTNEFAVCKCATCTRKSTVRYENDTKENGNGTFCRTSASTRGRRCNPLRRTHLCHIPPSASERAAYRAHVSQSFLQPNTSTLKSGAQPRWAGGDLAIRCLSQKCIAALATSFVLFLDQSRAATIMAHELPCPPTTTFSGSRASLIWWSSTRSFPPPFENWTPQNRGLRVNGAEISSRLTIGLQHRTNNGRIAPESWKTLSFLAICTISKRSVTNLVFFFLLLRPGRLPADLAGARSSPRRAGPL